jgi:acetylornithine deacetylase
MKYTVFIDLLKELIKIQSFSGSEDKTASCIASFLSQIGVSNNRIINNIWACNKHFNDKLPNILLVSHHDTVKHGDDWSINPFLPLEKDGKLFGLGSNDAGASLISLLATFIYFYEKKELPVNIVFAACAEEEISGKNGIEMLLNYLPDVSLAIVGEPTEMKMAVGERGLLVVDCIALGTSGHVAHAKGENAIYKAINDIELIRNFKFDNKSSLLGNIEITVSMINGGKQHNIIPDSCSFTIDIRTNDVYKNTEIIDILQSKLSSKLIPRSTRLNSSSISSDHKIVSCAKNMGIELFCSKTLSDMALLPIPAVKIGPGDSLRSHIADEFIYVEEIENGIHKYIELLKSYLNNKI